MLPARREADPEALAGMTPDRRSFSLGPLGSMNCAMGRRDRWVGEHAAPRNIGRAEGSGAPWSAPGSIRLAASVWEVWVAEGWRLPFISVPRETGPKGVEQERGS
jgi:hypothetical protein